MRERSAPPAIDRRRFCRGLILAGVGFMAASSGSAAGEKDLPADFVLVLKAQRRLILQRGGAVTAKFAICLGPNPVGPKIAQGDGRTPEGLYRIDGREAVSRYRRFLHISYPEPRDLAHAKAQGVSPGGGIGIHGLPGDYDQFGPISFDWTEGCIAVANRAIDEIWRRVELGTPIEILP